MDGAYLAVGFRDVDEADDRAAYQACLSLLDGLPYFQAYKQRSYELLELRPGMTLLEAGCGLAADAYRLAERVSPGGRVLALDPSATLIGLAKTDPRAGHLPVEFIRSDVTQLGLADGCVARCRIDRVLQHIATPAIAIAELARVLRPGGLLLAYDNDWGSFSVTSGDRVTTRTIETFWGESFASPWIGRLLRGLFGASGLADIQVHPSISLIDDLATADRVYNLRETARRAVAAGAVSELKRRDWIAELEDRSRHGGFAVALTAYTVVGRKPTLG